MIVMESSVIHEAVASMGWVKKGMSWFLSLSGFPGENLVMYIF